MRSSSLQLGVGVILLSTICGCGGGVEDKIGATLPVSGKVTIDGQPVSAGTVNFIPDAAKGNKADVNGFSMINDGGTYTLVAGTPTMTKPGMPPGWYKVTIKTNVPVGMQQSKTGAVMPESAGAAIAPKFTDVKQTPLAIEVKEGGSYDLQATSK